MVPTGCYGQAGEEEVGELLICCAFAGVLERFLEVARRVVVTPPCLLLLPRAVETHLPQGIDFPQ